MPPRWFLYLQGFAMLGVLHLVNPDALIVRTNLARPGSERPQPAGRDHGRDDARCAGCKAGLGEGQP